jgi:immune inhibitor A
VDRGRCLTLREAESQIHPIGPTACTAHPKVLKNIANQLEEHNIISTQELQVARRMGIVTTTPVGRPGFNDGMLVPYEHSTGGPASEPVRPEAALAPVEPKKPKKRKMHAIALLVDFSDNKGARPAKDFDKLLFDKANQNSMSNFYRQLSYGALDITGEVIGYVRAPQPYSYYTAIESGTGNNYPQNTPGLLNDVLTIFCQNDSLTRFDTDKDGFVDAILLIHAGGGAEAEQNPTKRKNMIWSHKWTLPQPFVSQGVTVFAYSTEPEDGRVGVFSHEFGHLLGLPDLYDRTFRSHGIGDWCLMAAGSWGDEGNRPARMSCWCLSKLGWIKPKVVTGKKSLHLNTLERKKTECCRLWTNGATGPEYFLLENRQAKGLDAALPGSGLAVWHIDERQSNNDNPLAYLVALVQADGKKDLELLKNSGDGGDLFPGDKGVAALDDNTMPSTRSNIGSPSRVALTNVATSGGIVTLRAEI